MADATTESEHGHGREQALRPELIPSLHSVNCSRVEGARPTSRLPLRPRVGTEARRDVTRLFSIQVPVASSLIHVAVSDRHGSQVNILRATSRPRGFTAVGQR